MIEKSGGGNQQPVGAVICYDHCDEAVCSNFIARMTTAECFDSRYLAYLHSHLYHSRVNTRSIKQTTGIQNLDLEAYLSECVAYPPFVEQQAISSFLDRKTTSIDALLSRKQLLIELLQERRQALISGAVTKGLDPSVPMTNPGIERLGEIPEHFRVVKLGRVAGVQPGFAFRSDSFSIDGVPIVRMSNLKGGKLDLSDAARIPSELCNPSYALHAGDLLLGMSGSIQNFAVVSTEDLPCQLNQRVGRIYLKDKDAVYYRFLYYLVQSQMFAKQVELLAEGTAQLNISSRAIERIAICLPPRHEQRTITRFLDREVASIEALTSEVQASIDCLVEYRMALISAAVTGRIDVREEEENGQDSIYRASL